MRLLTSTIIVFLLGIKSVFAVTPVDVLDDKTNQTVASDGTIVRKGTIAATLANIKLFDEVKNLADTDPTKQEQIQGLVKDQRELLAALNNVGLFEAFTPNEWISDEKKEGRILVALLYLQKYPQLITYEIHAQIAKLEPKTSKELKPYFKETLDIYAKEIKSKK